MVNYSTLSCGLFFMSMTWCMEDRLSSLKLIPPHNEITKLCTSLGAVRLEDKKEDQIITTRHKNYQNSKSKLLRIIELCTASSNFGLAARYRQEYYTMTMEDYEKNYYTYNIEMYKKLNNAKKATICAVCLKSSVGNYTDDSIKVSCCKCNYHMDCLVKWIVFIAQSCPTCQDAEFSDINKGTYNQPYWNRF